MVQSPLPKCLLHSNSFCRGQLSAQELCKICQREHYILLSLVLNPFTPRNLHLTLTVLGVTNLALNRQIWSFVSRVPKPRVCAKSGQQICCAVSCICWYCP
ncbi:hypothetical protein XELAEV_18044158mg [Xenopus laevis]|uniref:Uncharacterized protein n=1 Tax=Xenopus laevis TaxID=8355 RepID=A0A974H309_XENLA|nr:hypothetical protein XELAEV_18044158mg [Xenopus laevis]